ncbi:MAG: hypothetical protein ACKVP7_05540, partial [Hyphomicrobiaceae bacterium]
EGVREVEIVKIGNSRVISPVGQRWDSFFATGPHVSKDFLVERDQGDFEEREPLSWGFAICSIPTPACEC